MSFIQFDNVHKSYGDSEVLKGIDFTAEKHEVVCLIGASGSGKSTLLRCVNALEEIQEGKILVDGDIISGPGVAVNTLRHKVGMVFQSYNLFPNMSVVQNIMLAPVKLRGESKKSALAEAHRLLEQVNLVQHADYYPDQLSGGQQQRVAIVRAMAMKPEVLLLDEITSSLDPELVAEVLNIVRELAAQGMTMLLATHEMAFAKEVADKVVFLEQGRILEEGPPSQIFENPREERTRSFLKKLTATTIV